MMLDLNTKYPIGIDIGNRNIYAAQLKENKQGLVVSGLVHREYQGGSDGVLEAAETIVPLLKDIVRDKRFKGRRVVVHIPDQYVLNFPISFQVGKEETVEGAILRQSRQYLTFPPEEAVIDYPSLTPLSGDEGSRFKASIVAARTEHVNDYLSMLKQARLTVEVVDFAISSLLRLHNYPHKTMQNPLILCNVGATQTMLSVLTTESILVQRHIPWGMQTLMSNLQANLELSDDKERARVLLKKYGLFYEDCLECDIDTTASEDSEESRDMYRAIYQIINPLIEELVHEFHKVIGYARSEEQDAVFEGIYIYGQGTFIKHLDRYLEKRLNIQTGLMNPLTKVALADDSVFSDLSEGGPFGLALGLALRKVTWL